MNPDQMDVQVEAIRFLNCLFQNVVDEGNINFRFKGMDGVVFNEFLGINSDPEEIENLLRKHHDKRKGRLRPEREINERPDIGDKDPSRRQTLKSLC